MKVKVANEIRSQYINQLLAIFGESEDVGLITSNSFNFPIVCGEEEGWVEITVKVPKYSDNEGYELREDYKTKLEEKRVREEKAKAEKDSKIAKDKAKRQSKTTPKEE